MRYKSGEQKRGWQATRHVAAKQIKKQAGRRDQIRRSGQLDKKRVHRQGHYKLTLPAFKSEKIPARAKSSRVLEMFVRWIGMKTIAQLISSTRLTHGL